MKLTLTHRCAACHEEVRVTALWYIRPGLPKACICEACSASGHSFNEQGVVSRWAKRAWVAERVRLRLQQIEERTV